MAVLSSAVECFVGCLGIFDLRFDLVLDIQLGRECNATTRCELRDSPIRIETNGFATVL